MLLSHIAPTSPPTVIPSDTTPHHSMSRSGTSLYRTRSTHPSLYEQSRNLSPAHQPPISIPPGTPSTVHHEQLLGNDSPGDSESNHSLHRSYLCPLSCAMAAGQVSQAIQTPSMSHTPHTPQHPFPQWPSSTESMRILSHCSMKITPTPPA